MELDAVRIADEHLAPEAEEEIAAGGDSYERQQPGLGADFMSQIAAAKCAAQSPWPRMQAGERPPTRPSGEASARETLPLPRHLHRSSRRRDCSFEDGPRPQGDDWEEYGGELMWVAGRTESGVPFGLTVDELRRVNERDSAGAGWACAKYAVRDLLEQWSGPPTRAEVGFVKKIGRGLSRDIFAAEVMLRPDPGGRSGDFVVLPPRRDADPEVDVRARKELRLLGRLDQQKLPFRVPHVVGAYPVSGRLALVRRFLPGIELDLRAGRQPGGRPWETRLGADARRQSRVKLKLPETAPSSNEPLMVTSSGVTKAPFPTTPSGKPWFSVTTGSSPGQVTVLVKSTRLWSVKPYWNGSTP
jgi:hypothetical protein